MAFLTRDEIRAAAQADVSRKTLTITELGGDVVVRGMSGKELSLFHETLYSGKGKKRKVVTTNIQAKMAVRCVENADGSRMFTDEDAEWLGGLKAGILTRIYDAIQELSGIGDEDEDDADEEKK